MGGAERREGTSSARPPVTAPTVRGATPHVLRLEDVNAENRHRVGGKNASLASLLAAGLPVPPGFAVTTDAYEQQGERPDLRALVLSELDVTTLADPARLHRAAARIREEVLTRPLHPAVEDAVRSAYGELSHRCGVADVVVAVRSSATTEDLPDASSAGQHDSLLGVSGADAVVDAVRRCWASAWTDRAIAYRLRLDHLEPVTMAVGVQRLVDARVAGVALTLDPLTGDRSRVVVDASWGLGDLVVAGEVTPDCYVVDTLLGVVLGREVATKAVEHRLSADGIDLRPVEDARRDVPCLTDDEARAVATLARRAEELRGRPQDVEWALDRELPPGEDVVLLQARAETVWSRTG